MFPTNQVDQFAKNILNQIKNDQSFKNYHQSHQTRGLFAIVRRSFEEMVLRLQRFVPTQGNQKVPDLYKRFISGRKVWAYYQFKMFVWVVAWQRFQKRNSYNKNIKEEIQLIQSLFPSKCQQFLKYEYALIISKTQKLKCSWLNQQIDAFSQIVNQCQKLSSQGKSEINWKFLSFKLFIEHGYFKTPNKCRERWSNHLNPRLNKTKWHPLEDIRLLQIYQQHGAKWAFIARKLKNRTQHMVKNRFKSLRYKWMKGKKTATIFNINLLVRDIKSYIQNQEAVQSNRNQEDFQENSNIIIQEKIMDVMKEESSSFSRDKQQAYIVIEDVAKEKALSQINNSKGQESEQNIGLAMLSLADVGGEIELTKKQCIKYDQQALNNQIKCYKSLLDEPLWKNSDRIPTLDFQWISDMIEERNIQEFDEFI